MKTRGCTALMVALLVTFSMATPASALPPLPSGYYGRALIDGQNASEGSKVTAAIGGTQFAEAGVVSWQGESWYSLDVPADDPLTPQVEGGRNGDAVRFTLRGVEAAPGVSFQSGRNLRTDLTAGPPARLRYFPLGYTHGRSQTNERSQGSRHLAGVPLRRQ